MTGLELIGRRKDLDLIFDYLAGRTGSMESRVSLWKGSPGFERCGSSARYDAFNHPRVSSRSGRFAAPCARPLAR